MGGWVLKMKLKLFKLSTKVKLKLKLQFGNMKNKEGWLLYPEITDKHASEIASAVQDTDDADELEKKLDMIDKENLDISTSKKEENLKKSERKVSRI